MTVHVTSSGRSESRSSLRQVAALALGAALTLAIALGVSSLFFPPTSASVDFAEGEFLFTERCSGCHSASAERRAGFGPNLARIGAEAGLRKDGLSADEYILESLLEPSAFVAPGATGEMPVDAASGLTKHEIRSLVAYLASRGAKPDYHSIARLRIELPATRKVDSASMVDVAAIERGRSLFYQLGCNACHSVYAEPGHDLHAPSLARAGQLPAEYLRESLVEPDAVVSDAYALVSVQLLDGRSVDGRLLQRTDDELRVLALDETGLWTAVEVPLSAVVGEPSVQTTALMPEYGLDESDIDDLVAFLRIIAGEATGAM